MKEVIILHLMFFVVSASSAQDGIKEMESSSEKKAVTIARDHYMALSLLSRKPDSSFGWMDKIVYPAKEHATSSLAATKLRTVYLVEDVPSLLKISKPPANSSEQTRAELAFLRQLQEKRTAEEVRRYQQLAGIFHSPNNFNPHDKDYNRNFSSLFHIGSALGDWFTYKNLPKTAAFLSDVYRDATYYFFNLKLTINRPRPYMLDTALQNLERPQHASYPSGHSSASYVNAYIMSRIVPELSESFLKAAQEMAYSREVLGVHYPSDSEIGRIWANDFVNELFRHKKFRDDFEAAKKEILNSKLKQGDDGFKKNGKEKSSCTSSCDESCSSPCCEQ